MICKKCRKQKHEQCPAVVKQSYTLCDCAHRGQVEIAKSEKTPKAKNPRGAKS